MSFKNSAEAIASIEQMFAEMEEMQEAIGPVVQKLLPFRKNCALAGADMNDVTLNLPIEDFPRTYKFCKTNGWNTIIGIKIRWVAEQS